MELLPWPNENLSPGYAVEFFLNHILHRKARKGVLRLNDKKELILDLEVEEGWLKAMTVPLGYHSLLISRFKLLCDLDVSNRESPQKGVLVYEGHKFSVETQQVERAKEEIVITPIKPASPAEQ